MGDHEHGTALHQLIHALLDQALGAGVDGAGGLVQDQHRGTGNGRPRDGKKLSLSLGEIRAVAVKQGSVSVRQAADEGIRVGDARGLPHLRVRGIQSAVADVVRDGSREQVGILNDHGKGTAQVVLFDSADVQAVIGDGSGLNLVKPVDQVDDGGFPRSRGAHKGDLLPRLRVQTDAV